MSGSDAALYTERRPGVVLPTLPGLVHGIVNDEPYEVQCDECLVVRGGNAPKHEALQIMFSGILFNPRRWPKDSRRLCPECRAIHWKEYEK